MRNILNTGIITCFIAIYITNVQAQPLAGTDELGRTLLQNDAVGDLKQGRHVAMFYFLWQGDKGSPTSPKHWDLTEIFANHPEVMNDCNDPNWGGGKGTYYFWGKPIYGYYRGDDYWVQLRNIQLLTDAGVDFLVLDATNRLTYPTQSDALMKAMDVVRAQGKKPPRIVYYTNTLSGETIREIYEQFYMEGAPYRHPDCWFYLEGKPLIIGVKKDVKDQRCLDFFTIRESQWPNEPQRVNGWPWISFTRKPEVHTNLRGEREIINVSVAQHPNPSAGMGGAAFYNYRGNWGRSFRNNDHGNPETDIFYGYNIQEQWEVALKEDVPFIFVTGWNEWIAGRWDSQDKNRPQQSFFCDSASPEYSRDLEPCLTADLKDHYYMQLVNNIRRYKGVEKMPAAKALSFTIKNLNDWNKVDMTYTDYIGEVQPRNHPGAQSEPAIVYTNTTGRNDFHIMKVAHNKKELYFYVQTVDNITPKSDDSWMRLYIDADRNATTGWQGYDYRIVGGSTLQQYINGEWENISTKEVKSVIEKNRMMLTVPRTLLERMSEKVNFEFKWTDNMQAEDPMDWYINGDVAPGGRFNYIYTELVWSTAKTKAQELKKDTLSRIRWEHIGPGGGGAQFNPTISPHDPKTVFVTCDMGGSFVTYNGGESWRMFNLSHKVNFFVFDPVDPDVVYAQSYGLFKSADKGQTWHLFYPKPSDVEYVVSRGDHASESIVLKDGTRRSVLTLSIDPAQSKNMYAAIRINQSLALFSSIDGGIEWTKEKDFNHDVWNIFIDPSSPINQRSLYVTWSGGVEQRVNGQWSSYGVPGNKVRFNIFSGGFDAGMKKYILYALSGKSYLYNRNDTESGVFFSEDGGKTWENRQEGLLNHTAERENADIKLIATSALNPSTVYVSYDNFIIQNIPYCFGVAKSEDYGKTWTFPWKENHEIRTMPNYNGCWLSDVFSSAWGGSPFSFAVSAANADICYGSDYGRTIKTENGGKTWEAVYTKKLPDGSWTTTGIEVTTGYNVIFDPFDVNHIFFALTDIGLMESKNGGQGWLSATRSNGVPRKWINTTYWMEFDPEVKGRAWAVMSGIHDLPVPKMFRNGGVEKYSGGILLTNDGGATWQTVSASIGEAAMTHILIDPTSNKNVRTLYACAFGKGVYKSTDGGQTWTQKNKGIAGVEPFAWRIERRANDGTLFLIISRRSSDGSIGNDWDGAIYRSVDGAESWTKITLPTGCNGPTSLVVTDKYPNRLVLSAWGKLSQGAFSDTGGGIFISDDDGKTWTQVMWHDQHIYAISFDPRIDRFYACGFNASVYYSEDGAKNWTRSRGYNFKWGHRVIPDPLNAEMIYVVTFGGGVWHGPAKGDPEATEDLITILERK